MASAAHQFRPVPTEGAEKYRSPDEEDDLSGLCLDFDVRGNRWVFKRDQPSDGSNPERLLRPTPQS
jgi:hypothetical protein